LFVVLVGAGKPAATTQGEIGSISRLQGAGTIVSLGQMNPVVVGSPVHVDDIVSSNAEARMEISFVDGTRLIVGEKTSLKLERYVFDAGRGRGRLTVILEGSLRYISGRLGKSADDKIAVATPFASISLRGTDLWTGRIDEEQGVFLLGGKVEVANSAGVVTLDETGEGTSIAGPNTAPRPATRWPAEKVDRALLSVAF
jgi:hypothetical protein